MIKVHIKRNSQGKIQAFRVHGHADFSEAGTDIVCAAASMLIQNGVNSTEALLKIEIPCESRDGFIECMIPSLTDQLADQTQLLMDSMVCGLRTLAEEYPEHVSVTDKSDR